MTVKQELIDLLERAIEDRDRRAEHVKRFQERVWDSHDLDLDPDPEVVNVFRDLAHDLDYYEPDDQIRAEDWSYYGDARLEEEIRSAVKKLRP